MASPASSDAPAPRRRLWRWLAPRFSVRTLLIVVTLLSVGLGTWITRARRQMEACRELKSAEAAWRFAQWGDDHAGPKWFQRLPKSWRTGDAAHYWRTVDQAVARRDTAAACRAMVGLPGLRHLMLQGQFPNVGDPETWQAIGQLNTLRALELEDTAIDDEGLVEIAKLPRLTQLNVQGTRVTNTGLKHIAKMRTLEELILGETNIDDDAMVDVARLTRLKLLHLDRTRVTSRGLKQLAPLKQMERIRLDGTDVDDEIAETIRGWPNLKTLFAGDTRLTDAGIAQMLGNPSLEAVSCENDDVGRATLTKLGTLPRLSYLDLAGTKLRPGDICLLAGAKSLATLHLPRSVPLEQALALRRSTVLEGIGCGGNILNADKLDLLAGAPSKVTALSLNNLTVGLEQWKHLAASSTLTELRVGNCDLTDEALDALANSQTLTELAIADCPITDEGLKRLSRMSSLTVLKLKAPRITDIGLAALGDLRLEELRIGEAGPITDAGVAAAACSRKLRVLGVSCAVQRDATQPRHAIVFAALADASGLSYVRWGEFLAGDSELNVFFRRPIRGKRGEFDWPVDVPLETDQASLIAGAPSVEELEFSGRAITGEQLAAIGPLANVHRVVLNDVSVGRAGWTWLASLPTLGELWLNQTPIAEEDAEALARSPNLKEVHVSDAKLAERTLRHLSRVANLSRLILDECDVDPAGVEQIAANAPLLESLTISGVPISPNTLERVLKLERLTRLSIAGCQIGPAAVDVLATHGGRLTDLDAPGNGVAASEWKRLVSLLPNLDWIKTDPVVQHDPTPANHYTYDNELRWIRWQMARERREQPPRPACERHPLFASQELDAGSPLVDEDLAIEMVQTAKDFDGLDAGGGWAGERLLSELPRRDHFRYLNLAKTQVGDAELRQVARLTRLRTLDLSGCPITDAGLATLVQGCWRLKELDLTSTAITDEGVRELAKLRFVERLSLKNTHVTSEGVKPLQALRHLKEVSVPDGVDWPPAAMP